MAPKRIYIKGELTGLKASFQVWRRPDQIQRPLLVCLHGWLDNAASFSRLAPLLMDSYEIWAMDLPGHGKSQHLPFPMPYSMLNLALVALDAIRSLPRPVTYIVAHSLGGGVASILCGMLQEEGLEKVVFLDSIGPLSGKEEECATRFEEHTKALAQLHRPHTYYSTVNAAAEKRLLKSQDLDLEMARILTKGGLKKIKLKGWTWSFDRNLQSPSIFYLTEGQVYAFLKSIHIPQLFILATESYLRKFFVGSFAARRFAECQDKKVIEVQAGHHLHLQEPGVIAEHVLAFLQAIRNSLRS